MKKLYEIEHWYEDCPMLNPTIKKFFESNKKYFFAFCNSKGEYLGEFFESEPPEDIFIKSENRGDKCGAIFERNFEKEVNLEVIETLEQALIPIDDDVYEQGGTEF